METKVQGQQTDTEDGTKDGDGEWTQADKDGE